MRTQTGGLLRQTSLLAYLEIAPSLSARERLVFDAVVRFGSGLTARELFEAMKARGLVSEMNQVFPRLTALVAKRAIQYGPKRTDRYTGRLAGVVEVAK